MKTLGITIATPGRRSLVRALHSIAYQKAPVADVLVVGDGYDQATEQLVQLTADIYQMPFRYLATERTRDFGHSQTNYALKHVRGDYVALQDDDDIFAPRALIEMSERASRQIDPAPLIGRTKTPGFGLLWQVPGTETLLDGHCVVMPNDKHLMGWFGVDYNGDQMFIHSCVRNYERVEWTDRVWTITRPEWKMWPMVLHQGDAAWSAALYRDENGPAREPLLFVCLVWDTEDRARLTIDVALGQEPTDEELREATQFAVYACQGHSCWTIVEGAGRLAAALLACNFKPHEETSTHIEYVHDWPPDFWPPAARVTKLINSYGDPIPDWRDDVWSWRPRRTNG